MSILVRKKELDNAVADIVADLKGSGITSIGNIEVYGENGKIAVVLDAVDEGKRYIIDLMK